MIRKYVKYQEAKEKAAEKAAVLATFNHVGGNSSLPPQGGKAASSPYRGQIKAGPSGVGCLLNCILFVTQSLFMRDATPVVRIGSGK